MAVSTVVDLTPVVQAVLTTAGTALAAFAVVVLHKINLWLGAKTGQQNLLNEDVIRGYLDTAITNGVHFAITEVGTASWDKIDVKNALVKAALDYATSHVPDAIAYFKLDEADLEKTIAAKLNALFPTTPPVVAPVA